MPDSDSASVSVLARASYPDSFPLALALSWPDLEPDSDLDSEPEEEKGESSKGQVDRNLTADFSKNQLQALHIPS